jgi:glycosyltransferase involved in cell wall biosynthesis
LAGKILAPISHVATSRTIRNSDYVIYVTDKYLQRKYPTNGVASGISDVVVPETDHAVLDNRKTRIDACFGTRKVHLATIGAVDVKYKAQDDVIKAMAILASEGYDVDYTLIGGGSPARLRKCAEEKGVSLDKIHFMGAVPHEQIYELLDEFDLYIQPSRTEGMPRSVVEAMSRGLIVICSNVGGMPEFVDNKCVYRSGNITELTDTIRFMLDSKQRMLDTSISNFNQAKCFRRDYLDRKRSEFLTQVKNDFRK